jgi:Reverse transcriptase (RNA-dependent DNA polymerase)
MEKFLSEPFTVSSGVRQGGILSPTLFAIYTDVVIRELQARGYGLHIGGKSIGCIMYADDILLLSVSLSELQRMLNVCVTVLSELSMEINIKKSSFLRCGARYKHNTAQMLIKGQHLEKVEDMKYLGVVFVSGRRLDIDYSSAKSSFYRTFNSIYSRCSMAKTEDIPVKLMKNICIPKLLYGVEVGTPSTTVISSLDNSIYRSLCKIFH